jgi:DNA-directed RNA polymerase subunit RPC12/RpoP
MGLLPTYKCPHCGADIDSSILLKHPVPCKVCQQQVQIKLAHGIIIGAIAMFTTLYLARANIILAIVSAVAISLIGIRFVKLEKPPGEHS